MDSAFPSLTIQKITKRKHNWGFSLSMIALFTSSRAFVPTRQLPKVNRSMRLLSGTQDQLQEESLRNRKEELLHKCLDSLSIDFSTLSGAARQSIEAPAEGYDGRFGKSAIKTYRSFLKLKPGTKDEYDAVKLPAMAERCANQIQFLLKRHESHRAEWVRHHDQEQSNRQVFPLVLLLDNLRSANNVGSIFRTADAAGCELIITTGITPSPHASGSEKLAKSGLGAEIVVPSIHFPNTKEALDHIRREMKSHKIYAMETTERSMVYTDVQYSDGGVVLVLGNEVTGVGAEVLKESDGIVEIPMFGSKNSLNVAACAPVVLYEVLRQWSFHEKR